MKHKYPKKLFLIYLVFVIIILPKPVSAYLDPGSGSYLLQIAAASFFAVLFVMKSFWKKINKFVANAIKDFFYKIFRKDQEIVDKLP